MKTEIKFWGLEKNKSKSNAKVAWDIFIILQVCLKVQYVKSQICKGKGVDQIDYINFKEVGY